MGDSNKQGGSMVWAGYALLLLFSFSLYSSILFWAGLAALAFGYFLRRQARLAEQNVTHAHAAWQVNTVWLAFALALAGVVCLVIIAGWMGNDPAVMAKLDDLSTGSQAPVEILRQFWAIPGSKALVGVIICSVLLYLVLTLKRTIQGIMAQWRGLPPNQKGSDRWIALLLALVIQAGVFMLAM